MAKLILSDLIKEYGDDKVTFQLLDTSIMSMNKRKQHNEITFGTSQGFGLKTNQMGIVVWLDRDKVDEILLDFKNKKEEEEK